MKIFLTGEKQIGKSTVINECLRILGIRNPFVSVGGFKTVMDGNDIVMHSINVSPEISGLVGRRYESGFPDAFNTIGCEILSKSHGKDILIMDELGWMEENAEAFNSAVESAITSNSNVLGVLRKNCETKLNKNIAQMSDVTVIEVNLDNRDNLPMLLAKLFIGSLTKCDITI